MRKNLKYVCLLAVGIALFTALSLCLQVPVYQNYYLCLGYVVMAVYCWCFGPAAGTAVGFFGVVLYCLLTSGLRGMPGWALGNVVIGLALGFTFRAGRKLRSAPLRTVLYALVIALSCAVGILGVKSLVDSVIRSQFFIVRVGSNLTAFVADVVVLWVSLPICMLLEKPARRVWEPERTTRSR